MGDDVEVGTRLLPGVRNAFGAMSTFKIAVSEITTAISRRATTVQVIRVHDWKGKNLECLFMHTSFSYNVFSKEKANVSALLYILPIRICINYETLNRNGKHRRGPTMV